MGKSSRGVKSTFNPNNFSTVALVSQNRKIPANKVKHESTRKVAAVRERKRYCDFIAVTITSLIVVGIAIFVTYQQMLNEPSSLMSRNCNKLVVLIHSNETSTTINQVFENLGYAIVHDANENWNILWTKRDPFKLYADHMTKLKPHQLVNHINHSMLVIPRAFQLPQMKLDLMDYQTKNPQTGFIIKECMVDGHKADINNIDMNYDANFAVHAFHENSLLIDGHRFYFGVFFLISSVEPLRVYRYNGDVMARFGRESQKSGNFLCQEILSRLEIQSLKKFSEFSTKHAMEEYLKGVGVDMKEIYKNIDEEVAKFLVKQFKNIKKSPDNFMQIIRVDFSIVNNKDVKITDIELSNNFDDNEGLVYEALKVVGASNPYEFKCRSLISCPLLSSSKDILVNANTCLNFPCNESCSSPECELCLSCLTQVPVALNHLHRSYREQMRCGGNMKRIFPKHYDDSLVNQLSPSDRLLTKWFQAKCDAEGGDWC